MSRIYLSPPSLSGDEQDALSRALQSGWIAPVGPELGAFETELAQVVDVPHAVALSSGTAALHLALLVSGVSPGDRVACPSLTFAATANAIRYCGAEPIFVDSEAESWNLDPTLLENLLERCRSEGRPLKAVISVDLYGQSADYDRIVPLCERHEVPLIEDAAEALGAHYRGRPVGSFGQFGVFSFNGNKIITTSGGGMLVSHEADGIDRARHLATQAKEPAAHYEHHEVGYNYRLSNLLAALGRSQLATLEQRVARRRDRFEFYSQELGNLPGVEFMPEPEGSRSSRWLSVLTLDPAQSGTTPEAVRLALEAEDIEARPVWKPMHQQKAFATASMEGGAVAERLFAHGLCLPSGDDLTAEHQERVISIFRSAYHG